MLFTSNDDHGVNVARFFRREESRKVGGDHREYRANQIKLWIVIDGIGGDGGQCSGIERDLVDQSTQAQTKQKP